MSPFFFLSFLSSGASDSCDAPRDPPLLLRTFSVLADYIHAGVFASYVINEYGSDQVNRLHCLSGSTCSEAFQRPASTFACAREPQICAIDAESGTLELVCGRFADHMIMGGMNRKKINAIETNNMHSTNLTCVLRYYNDYTELLVSTLLISFIAVTLVLGNALLLALSQLPSTQLPS